MPRQGWETNKAGGKGPAAAGEGDKSQPQPHCPVHPCSRTGPRAALLRTGPRGSGRDHPPLLPTLPTTAPAAPRPAQTALATGCWGLLQSGPPRQHGGLNRVCEPGRQRAPALPAPNPPCAPRLGPAWGWAALGCSGRAPAECGRVWGWLLRGRVGASAGRAAWQADG